jgi:hypothetical protein
LICGCATVPIHEPSIDPRLETSAETPTARRRSYITTTEVQSANATSTLDMIRALRPEFLRPSMRMTTSMARPEPSVYENQTYLGGLLWLERISLADVRQVEFLDPFEAHARFGSTCVCEAGILVVRTSMASTFGPR